jgi:hypothetical protein
MRYTEQDEKKSNFRINAHSFFVFAEILVRDYSVNLGKKSVIPATAYVCTRMNFGSQLTNKNVARLYDLTSEAFYAPTLTGTVPAVS